MTKNFRLYKFGKRRNIYNLAHHGKLYLTPASAYSDKSLSKGAFDDEELQLIQSLPEDVKFELLCPDTGRVIEELEVDGAGEMSFLSGTNYYVFCMTYIYHPDFYDEFDADTCLVITDPDRYINQACKSIMNELPDWTINAGSVRYKSKNDVFNMDNGYRDIFYGKSDEYRHQREIRIVCAPPKSILNLLPITVDIGNLYGYSFITGIEDSNKMVESEYSNALGSPFSFKES